MRSILGAVLVSLTVCGCGGGGGASSSTSTSTQSAAPQVVYRRAGDKYMLIEYGALILDLELRLRVHALMQWLELNKPEGIIELTPGIR